MSKQALLDMIPGARRKTVYHEEDGKTYIETRQDVEHIIEAAKLAMDQKPDKEMTRVAYIPEEVLNQSFLEGWFHDNAQWRKWANDPANACYRTTKGTI